MATIQPISNPTLRQRGVAVPTKTANGTTQPVKSEPSATSTKNVARSGSGISIIEVLRIITGLTLVAALSSYLTTGTWTWNLSFSSLQRSLNGPLTLTPTQLTAYSGTTPDKPILLAINRTVYDVSASPHVYGPGGMYSTLAAKDASRSYITTCFDPVDDLVPYLTGVEEVYVPLWLSRRPGKEELEGIFAPGGAVEAVGAEGSPAAKAVNGKTTGEMIKDLQARIPAATFKKLQDQAYEKARERVKAQIQTWEGMFERKGYPVVGRVVGVDETGGEWEKLGFCEAARRQRPGMGESLGEAMREMGMAGAVGGAGAGAGHGAHGAHGGEGGDAHGARAPAGHAHGGTPHGAYPPHAAAAHAHGVAEHAKPPVAEKEQKPARQSEWAGRGDSPPPRDPVKDAERHEIKEKQKEERKRLAKEHWSSVTET